MEFSGVVQDGSEVLGHVAGEIDDDASPRILVDAEPAVCLSGLAKRDGHFRFTHSVPCVIEPGDKLQLYILRPVDASTGERIVVDTVAVGIDRAGAVHFKGWGRPN